MRNLYLKLLMLMACTLSLFSLNGMAAPVEPENITQIMDLNWQPADNMPPGAQYAILLGNPEKEGFFIVLIKLPPNYTVPVHSHPINEYDLILKGTYYLGMGDTLDYSNVSELSAGHFVSINAQQKHYGYTGQDETTIQVSGFGPWGMQY